MNKVALASTIGIGGTGASLTGAYALGAFDGITTKAGTNQLDPEKTGQKVIFYWLRSMANYHIHRPHYRKYCSRLC